MTTSVLVLGAGFGGLELSTRLIEELGDDVEVTLVDRSDAFVLGYTKLDVLVGARTLESVRLPYRGLPAAVRFRQETVLSIDPAARRVVTDGDEYRADVLVVALGADHDLAATPGLAEGGYEFYSPEGAARGAEAVQAFDAGRVVIGVLGPVFSCPPAPNEAALMMHDLFLRRGVREQVDITLVTPLPSPIPVSPETSHAIEELLAERGIAHWRSARITHLEPATGTAHLEDGRSLPYDLFLGVPVHRAPAVVERSDLAEDGWIPVDPATFATRFPGVYAIGDVTSAPVPRAGSIAEGEARTVADVLIAALRGAAAPPPYAGTAVCYVDAGSAGVARVDVDFLSGPKPAARFAPPSEAHADEKQEFGRSRARRWLGG